MKCVILAGGLGTRISEESHMRPKPMIEIGGLPMLWHIMKIYTLHGITDFVICCGYKGYIVKEYFANYFLHMSDVTFDMKKNEMHVHRQSSEPWKVTLVDTGEMTQTGGRLRRVREHLQDTFCLTYGDGVSDVDISAIIAHHRKEGREATLTAIQPTGRYGALDLNETTVAAFNEKPKIASQWINGGFFVCEPAILDRIEGDDTLLERDPLEAIAREGKLGAYRHTGFWASMDTLREKNVLEALWAKGEAPWRLW